MGADSNVPVRSGAETKPTPHQRRTKPAREEIRWKIGGGVNVFVIGVFQLEGAGGGREGGNSKKMEYWNFSPDPATPGN